MNFCFAEGANLRKTTFRFSLKRTSRARFGARSEVSAKGVFGLLENQAGTTTEVHTFRCAWPRFRVARKAVPLRAQGGSFPLERKEIPLSPQGRFASSRTDFPFVSTDRGHWAVFPETNAQEPPYRSFF